MSGLSLEQFIDLVEGPLKQLYYRDGLTLFNPITPIMYRDCDGTLKRFGSLGASAQLNAFIRHEWPKIEPWLDAEAPWDVVERIRASFPLLARMMAQLNVDPTANLDNLDTKMADWLDREAA